MITANWDTETVSFDSRSGHPYRETSAISWGLAVWVSLLHQVRTYFQSRWLRTREARGGFVPLHTLDVRSDASAYARHPSRGANY